MYEGGLGVQSFISKLQIQIPEKRKIYLQVTFKKEKNQKFFSNLFLDYTNFIFNTVLVK